MLAHGTTIRTQARALLAGTGVAASQWHADQLVAFIDGLLFDRLVGAGALSAPVAGTAESRDDLARAVRAALYAMEHRWRPAGGGTSQVRLAEA